MCVESNSSQSGWLCVKLASCANFTHNFNPLCERTIQIILHRKTTIHDHPNHLNYF